ncbi:heparinase II/III family protein [Opitutales bacterium]|nr:heparinase II/III family protein [Opitutales bacterium]
MKKHYKNLQCVGLMFAALFAVSSVHAETLAEQAQQMLDSTVISALEHPYILFHKKDVPQIAQRSQTAPYKYIWENLTAQPPGKTDGVVNAFIYAITGDVERGRAAHQTLADLCALPSWGAKAKLEVSGKCRPAGLIYDMIYDLLTPAERDAFSQKIAQAGILRLYNDTFTSWWSQRRQHNYSAAFNSAYGIAALAILKEQPEAIEWIHRASDRTQLFLRSQGPAGGYGEGINYWCMSLRSIFPFMDGLRNVFGLDLYDTPYLTDATGNFVLYSLSPDRRSTLNFNDAGINRKYDPHVMVRLASACGWSQIAKVVEQDLAGAGEGSIEFDWPGNVPPASDGKPRSFALGDIYSFLWYDAQAASAPLDTLPRSRFFPGIGWAVMRSGWDKNALQFGIISAPKFFGNHENADRGSIILNAYGERFICDAGKPWTYGDPIIEPWYRGSAGHNLLLVNGSGQTTRDQLAAPGRMSRFVSTPHFDYVRTENAGPYDGAVSRWDRHAIYAVPEFVILYDQVELPEAGTLGFRYHSPGSRKILPEGQAALLPGDNAAAIPSYGSGKRWAAAHYGADYQQSDWWKTGHPAPEMTDWTEAETVSADLLLQSFSLSPSTLSSHGGYQDYRMPATFLDQTYSAVKETSIITILYPRSAEMKASQQVPVISDLSDEASLAVQIEREGKQHLIAAGGVDGRLAVGALSAVADFASVALGADALPTAALMIDGTQLSYGDNFALTADSPLLAVVCFERDQVRIVLDSSAANGADLRIQLPEAPQGVSLNGSPAAASLTPKNHLAEFHIPSGRTEVVLEYQN